MKLTLSLLFAVGLVTSTFRGAMAQEKHYVRGDSNGDSLCDISDAIHLLGFLFLGGPAPVCRISADANVSGGLDISDAVTILTFLFQGGVTMPVLTLEEEKACAEPYVIRRGRFDGFLNVDEFRSVSGMAEELSNRTIRLTDFFYDGEGGGDVFVWLHKGGDKRLGHPISPSIRVGYPGFEGATLTYPIPEDITDDMFHSVCIWCNSFYLNFGDARLTDLEAGSP